MQSAFFELESSTSSGKPDAELQDGLGKLEAAIRQYGDCIACLKKMISKPKPGAKSRSRASA